jgi:hypothetical protein
MDTKQKLAKGIIDSVEVLIELLNITSTTTDPHSHVRLWCRGQSNFAWAIKPKLYRDDFTPTNEYDRHRIESHLSLDFKALAVSNLTGHESEQELYFLQQHFGMRTRLIDWTSNPLIALWFAVESLSNDDGGFYIMDVYQMRGLPEFFGIATPEHEYFTKSLKSIREFAFPGDFHSSIFPIRPGHKSQRIRHQQSFFTFHVPGQPVLTHAENPTLRCFKVPADAKKQILDTLRILGIDSYFVYGGIEKLSTELDYAYIGRFKK